MSKNTLLHWVPNQQAGETIPQLGHSWSSERISTALEQSTWRGRLRGEVPSYGALDLREREFHTSSLGRIRINYHDEKFQEWSTWRGWLRGRVPGGGAPDLRERAFHTRRLRRIWMKLYITMRSSSPYVHPCQRTPTSFGSIDVRTNDQEMGRGEEATVNDLVESVQRWGHHGDDIIHSRLSRDEKPHVVSHPQEEAVRWDLRPIRHKDYRSRPKSEAKTKEEGTFVSKRVRDPLVDALGKPDHRVEPEESAG